MNRREVLEYCLSYAGAYEDYPFDQGPGPESWTAVRHTENKKIFALIYERRGTLCVNLKCDPQTSDFFRSVFPWVTPGYHMNHIHWNTLWLDGREDVAAVWEMIGESYRLTSPKRKKQLTNEKTRNIIAHKIK